MPLGTKIRAARQSQGLTLKQLGAQCGVTAAHLSNIENGKVSVSRRALEQIAAGLGLTANSLLADEVDRSAAVEVVLRRGRSGAETYIVEWLSRALYEDFISGRALAESGWRGLSEIVSQYSAIQEQRILEGLVALGIIASNRERDSFRLKPEANKQNALVKNCLNLQDYRNRFADDKKRLDLALREAGELLDGLVEHAGNEDARVIVTVSGFAAAIRDTSFRIDPETLLKGRILSRDFDRARIQMAATAAFTILTQTVTASLNCEDWLDRARRLWEATPFCRKSGHYLCGLVSCKADGLEAAGRILIEMVRITGLDDVPIGVLVPVYGSWVVWGYLERRGFLPFTDEGRIKLWAPGIYGRLSQTFGGLPDDLQSCGAQIADFIEKLEPRGESCEEPDDPSTPRSTASTEGRSPGHWQRVELLRFPWDET